MIEGVSITNGQNGIDSAGVLEQGNYAKHQVTAIDVMVFNSMAQSGMLVHLVI